MKKILIISDYFPPIGSVASLRSAYVSIAFQERGWEVHIVCRQLEKIHFIDTSIPGLPPETNIHRIKVYETTVSNVLTKAINLFHKILRPEYYRDRKGFYKSCFSKSSEIIEKHKVDYIYTSSGPEATILIGYNLKKRYKIRWIADFRDIPEMYKFEKITDKLYKKSLIHRQNRLLQLADIIITVSEPLAHALEERLGRKVEVILNGFDLNLHSRAVNPRTFHKFNIVYLGQIHGIRYQDPRPVLQILDNLILSDSIEKDNLSLEFYGTQIELVETISRPFNCRSNIKVHPQCSLFESIVHQHEAFILLLLTVKHQKGIYTTKLFEYLASGRPIIAFPDDKDVVKDLISKFNAGVCSNDPEEIKKAIIFWYAEWLKGKDLRIHHNINDINMLTRQYQCNKLVTIVEDLDKRSLKKISEKVGQ